MSPFDRANPFQSVLPPVHVDMRSGDTDVADTASGPATVTSTGSYGANRGDRVPVPPVVSADACWTLAATTGAATGAIVDPTFVMVRCTGPVVDAMISGVYVENTE